MDKKIIYIQIMKNLVIGSEGFLGRYLCKFLEKKGEKVIHFDIKRGKKEDARYAKLPLRGIDKVYFLAWEVGGAKYLYKENTQLKQLKWNVELLNNVMTQLEKAKITFVFVSSQLAEENTVYGITKKLGEFWTKYIGGCFLRIPNIYGVMQKSGEKSHVIEDFVNQVKAGKKIKLLSGGEEKRQFIHMEDVCELMYKMDKEWISIKEVADIIQTISLEEGLRKMIKK